MKKWLVLLPLLAACGAPPALGSAPSSGLAPPIAPPPASRWAPPALRLCGWNIRKLGHGSRTDHDLVAQAIDEGCDLVAVMEVMQKQGGHPGYDDLLDALHRRGTAERDWTGAVTDSPRPRTPSGSAEHYAVFWRADRLAPCDEDAGLRYHRDHDGSDEGGGVDLFLREPAFACFRSRLSPSTGPGSQDAGSGVADWRGPDFVLATYHARWADGAEAAIVTEVRHLPEVFAAMATAYPGEGDLWLLGDLNLRPERLDVLSPLVDYTAVEAGSGRGSTLNRRGERTDNLYDHLVVHDPGVSGELRGPAQVMDVRSVAASPEAFFQQVSDHLPIVVELDPSVADDD